MELHHIGAALILALFAGAIAILIFTPNKQQKVVEQNPTWECHQVAKPGIYLLTTPDGRQYIVNWNGGIAPYPQGVK